MCVGCAAAYAAIAASTVTYSLSDLNGKESAFSFTMTSADLAKAAAMTTTPAGTAAITIKSAAPEVKAVAINRGIDPTSHQAI
jgi:GH25 family lysozyme M1 (1,4-beta-N-acetylmuramidase)